MGMLLAISSSPRRQGNSELLLDAFSRGAEKAGWTITHVRLNELNLRPCQACDYCAPTGKCIIDDDMQELYRLVAVADSIVMGTPIYFGTVSAQLKIFIDRFQCWWHAKYNLKTPEVSLSDGKSGYFTCVGARHKEDSCQHALDAAKIYFHNVNYTYRDCLCYQGIDERGAIRNHPKALQQAWEMGHSLSHPRHT